MPCLNNRKTNSRLRNPFLIEKYEKNMPSGMSMVMGMRGNKNFTCFSIKLSCKCPVEYGMFREY